MSIIAAVAMVALGLVIVFALHKTGAGVICLAFGAVALLLWADLLPSYRRRGYL